MDPEDPQERRRLEQEKILSSALNKRLERVRSEMGLSFGEWSDRAGLSRDLIPKFQTRLREKGRSDFGAGNLLRLARAAEVSILWLLIGVREPRDRALLDIEREFLLPEPEMPRTAPDANKRLDGLEQKVDMLLDILGAKQSSAAGQKKPRRG